MHYGSSEDQMQRVRSILNIMDRSIDAARARRENPDAVKSAMPQRPGIERSAPTSDDREARLPKSIFDRNGPRLKARPKRTDNGNGNGNGHDNGNGNGNGM